MIGRFARIAALLSLCLANTAFALGLGEIDLRSALNQPLRATIPLLGVDASARDGVVAQIASPEAFARVGLERASILSDIHIQVTSGANDDQSILQLTTTQGVREPYLSVLIEVESDGARVLREYTLLLDPPVVALGQSAARARGWTGSGARRGGSAVEASAPLSNTPGSNYGPVKAQETLWHIAYALRPDPNSITMDQMQLAIYRANPDAFEGGIGHIRSGSILRIPSADEIRRIDPDTAKSEITRQRHGGRPQTLREEDAGALASRPATRHGRSRHPSRTTYHTPKGQLRLVAPEAPPVVEVAPAAVPVQPQNPQAQPVQPSQPVQSGSGTSTIPPPAEAAAAPQASGPIQVRDNSMKALELLAAQAREAKARGQVVPNIAAVPATQPAAPANTNPATAQPSTPAVAASPVASAPAAPGTAQTSPAAGGPFVDQQPAATNPGAKQPGGVDNAETVDVYANGKNPPARKTVVVDDSVPTVNANSEGLLSGPHLVVAAVLVLLLALGFQQYRKRRGGNLVKLPPLLPGEEAGIDAPELRPVVARAPIPAGKPAPRPPADDFAATAKFTLPQAAPVQTQKLPVAPSHQATQQITLPSSPAGSQSIAPAQAPMGGDAYADALAEADIHIAYGLYDEAIRLLEEPLAKSPQRRDLHLKMLEVYFSASMAKEFQAQAQKFRQLLPNTADADWEKVCIMGRQICPDSSLFAETAASATSSLGGAADLDLSSFLEHEPQASLGTPPAVSAEPAPPTTMDWQDLQPLEQLEPVQSAVPAKTPTPSASAQDTMEFDLSDLTLDLPPAASTSVAPPAPKPAPVAAPTTAPDLDLSFSDIPAPASAGKPFVVPATKPAEPDPFQDLDIDLSSFDVEPTPAPEPLLAKATVPAQQPGTPAPVSNAASPVGSFDTDDDPLISGIGGDGSQVDTRLDLARAYIDMGEPTMAQSLLQEVVAHGNAAQKQEAQELLKRVTG